MNSFDGSVLADPYPFYAQLRREDPVHEYRPGIWLLTRYSDVSDSLRDDHRFGNDHRKSHVYRLLRPGIGDPSQRSSGSLLFLDPPDHTRLRRLVLQAFTARRVEQLRPRIRRTAEELVERAIVRRHFDLVSDVALPLSTHVICDVLGVPQEARELFESWSDDLVVMLDAAFPAPVLRRAHRATRAFFGLFRSLIEDRRSHPHEDLISALTQAEVEGGRLTPHEVLGLCLLLTVAGHSTTTALVSNGMRALLERHRQEWPLDGRNALVIQAAVDEMLRLDAPVQLTARTALSDVTIGDRRIQQGEVIIPIMGAANRDPSRFPDPDRFHAQRQDKGHLAFGTGIHHCLGAALGRTEAEVVIGELALRAPTLVLAGDSVRKDTLTLRGLQSLPVVVAWLRAHSHLDEHGHRRNTLVVDEEQHVPAWRRCVP